MHINMFLRCTLQVITLHSQGYSQCFNAYNNIDMKSRNGPGDEVMSLFIIILFCRLEITMKLECPHQIPPGLSTLS